MSEAVTVPSSAITMSTTIARRSSTLVQRREIGRQLLRQHRKDFRGGIDGGRVGPRVVVDRGVFPDQRIDVRDRDEDFHRAARRGFGDRELIQILGIVVVDRRPKQAAQIANLRAGRLGGLRYPVCLGDDGQRKVRQQSALEHRVVRDGLESTPAVSVSGCHYREKRPPSGCL